MKKFFMFVLVFAMGILSFSEGRHSNVVDFYRGNIADKISIVSKASEAGDSSVALKSVQFLIETNDVLSNDDDYNLLAELTIRTFNSRNVVGIEKQVSSRLCSLFKMTGSNRVKIAIIDFFYSMPNAEAVQLINDFFYKKMQNHNPVDDSVIKAAEFMGTKGNAASFNRLFIADILEVWPEFSPKIAECYGNLAEENRREILQMVVSVPADKKILILKKLNANPKISKKICGECAENVLSLIIDNAEEVKSREKKEDLITLEMLCLNTIARTKWTRASSIAAKSFERLRAEYEVKDISDAEFADVISDVASVAVPDTVMVLSSYLDFLNKRTESGQAPAEDVVLSVINSLGELGDNRAFDFIYAATSLEYPDEVIEAAKSAITKLKW